MCCSWAITIALLVITVNICKCQSTAILPPFRQLDHNLQSGTVMIIDNRTFLITKLHYDGLGPDTHFWVGKGNPSPIGILVANELNSTDSLSAYNGQDVKIKLPQTTTIKDIDYLAVWSVKLNRSFGHVFLYEKYINQREKTTIVPFVLPPFRGLSHGLKSGPITIINEKAFNISSLYFDANATYARFWAGTGRPSLIGKIVPNELGSTNSLSSYDGSNITITLPGKLTINNIDYLAVWDIRSSEDFGHVYLRGDFSDTDVIGYPVGEFSRLHHGLRSGPILLINEKTFYITNLHYDGKGPDAHFWVGKGEPSTSGILVANEKGSRASLSGYSGESVYVTLPGNMTVRDIDYLGMWCIKFTQNFGHVKLNFSEIRIPPGSNPPDVTANSKRIIRVPKCCPINKVMSDSKCESSNQSFKVNIDTYLSNGSVNISIDEPMSKARIEYIPFYSKLQCTKFKTVENYAMLTTGKMVFAPEKRAESPENYCLDMVKTGTDFTPSVLTCDTSTVPTGGGSIVEGSFYGACVTMTAKMLVSYFMANALH